jgi:hypothetical protein
MHQEVINPKTKRVLATLGKIKKLKDFYLAGGTALALQIGHRKSLDLDWFSQKNFSPSQLKRDLSFKGRLTVETEDEKTLNCIWQGVKLSFFFYPYRLLFPLINFNNYDIKLADERDIAGMKIDAISSRGSRKDFIDLYFLLSEYSLKELLNLFDQKYAKIKYNRFHILKSLVYFIEAELEPMPEILEGVSWPQVKNKLKKEVENIVNV